MSSSSATLFSLMPALYRLKDAQQAQLQNLLSAAEQAQLQALQQAPQPLTAVEQQQLSDLLAKASRGPLESLLMLIEEQLAVMGEDLSQLYDNQFIETCAPWVIPYIGDLIGYQSVNGVAPSVASPRAEVAHTISFRRRKGTVLVLEQLARDVTGWGAHAVEFFKVLADTQYMNHIRPDNYYAPNLRSWRPRAYINTGFDATSHRVDVRRIAVERGRYNIQNIGIFLWSLNAYSLTMSPVVPISGSTTQFHLNSLGLDAPLFNHPISQGADITAPAQPFNVPDVLLREVLCRDLRRITTKNQPAVYYGAGKSLVLYLDGLPVDPSLIQVCDLYGPNGSWINLPAAGSRYAVAIDPESGRIAVPPPGPTTLAATFYYGFNADMAGGEYSRSSTFTASPEQTIAQVPGDYPTIQQALNALGGDGVVEITNSSQYSEPAGLTVAVKANGHIELRAADGFRPTLNLGGEISVTGGAESAFDINGLVITYTGAGTPTSLVHALDTGAIGGQLSQLSVLHCTLQPGSSQPALWAEAAGLQVVIQKSIVGELWINGLATASISDSIVDATSQTSPAYAASVHPVTQIPQPGGALTMQGCTVIGKIYASLLSLVSDSIVWAALLTGDTWAAPLWATRKQEGCVRFSYLPAGSIVPRQFKCVEEAPGVPQPLFYSERYGDPAYAKLSPLTDDTIRRGADDGGEMGGFHFVLAPLRETDLRVRVQEYLPVGLEFGVFYET